MQQIQNYIPQCRKDKRCIAGSDSTLVFAKADVAHMKNSVLNRPVASHQAQQVASGGLVSAQRRNSIDNLDTRFAVESAVACELECLCDKGPIQERVQTGATD